MRSNDETRPATHINNFADTKRTIKDSPAYLELLMCSKGSIVIVYPSDHLFRKWSCLLFVATICISMDLESQEEEIER